MCDRKWWCTKIGGQVCQEVAIIPVVLPWAAEEHNSKLQWACLKVENGNLAGNKTEQIRPDCARGFSRSPARHHEHKQQTMEVGLRRQTCKNKCVQPPPLHNKTTRKNHRSEYVSVPANAVGKGQQRPQKAPRKNTKIVFVIYGQARPLKIVKV